MDITSEKGRFDTTTASYNLIDNEKNTFTNMLLIERMPYFCIKVMSTRKILSGFTLYYA
jgi:hypothetical protein